MIIGHHILYGKEIELDQPILAVTNKNIQLSGEKVDESDCAAFNVQAIIRNKLVFKSRPKPIIANVP